MNEMVSVSRDDWPAITMMIFRNYQWGAEKRNSTLWFDDNFVGTELDQRVSYAGIAKACGLQGVVARTMDELTAALAKAIEDQKAGKTTRHRARVRRRRRAGLDHGRVDRCAEHRRAGADEGRQDHLYRSAAEPGTGRTLPS